MPAPIDILGLKEKLTAERSKLLESFANLTPAEIMRPCEGGWSIKDLLAHVAASEGINVKFAKAMVSQDAPEQVRVLAGDYTDFPPPFDLDKFNAYMMERLRAQSPEQVIAALNATRADTLAWLETLTPADLERSGTHAVWGKNTVREMMRVLVIHEKMHRGDIEKRVTRDK